MAGGVFHKSASLFRNAKRSTLKCEFIYIYICLKKMCVQFIYFIENQKINCRSATINLNLILNWNTTPGLKHRIAGNLIRKVQKLYISQ